MNKAKLSEIDDLPKIKLLGAQLGWKQRNEVLSSFAQCYFSGKKEAINVLEAGCGHKWHLDLGAVKYKLTGVDIDKNALDFRRNNEGDLTKAIVGDLRDVELGQNEFDIIYCADVIEHIEGAENVIANFFAWLKTKGLLILVFPDRDSVFGFITRTIPHWAHILFYKYAYGSSNAGKPGFGPFPTYYDEIVSRRAIHDYCHRNRHRILLEYGRPYDFSRIGWLASGARPLFKAIRYLSFGKLDADHAGLIYVIQK